MMYCSACGKELATGARFCPHCGAAVAGSPAYTSARPARPLLRSRTDRVLGGVCAAFAFTYGWDLTLVRVLTVVGTVLLPPFVLIGYLAAWMFMPEEPVAAPSPPPNQA